MYFAEVDVEKCNGCKLCVLSCPEPNAIIFKPKEKKVFIDTNRCKGCGLCVEVCPKKALAIVSMV